MFFSIISCSCSSIIINLQNYLGPQGIRVHDILPGNIKSPLKEGQLREALKNTGDEKTYEEHYAELGDPTGVAKIVAFIISDDASYLKGSIVTRWKLSR